MLAMQLQECSEIFIFLTRPGTRIERGASMSVIQLDMEKQYASVAFGIL